MSSPSSATFLLAHFDRLAETPGGIAKLRALVLRLAVRGKLVAQNSSDEPAYKSIERVRVAKKAPQSVSKDKRSGNTDAAAGESKLEIPDGWAVTTMADFSLKITDGTHKTPNYVPKGVPFISVKDFSAGILSFANTRFISQEEHDFLYRRCDPKRGDIIFGRIGTLGKAVLVDTDQPFSLFVSVGLVRFSQEHANLDYFKLLLNSPFMTDQFEKIKVGGGTHTNKLNLGDLSSLELMIPPLAEQRRIVAKVEELMGLCDALEAAQQEREAVRTRLRTSALHQLASPDPDSKSAAFALNQLNQITTDSEDIASVRASIWLLAATGRITASATTVFQSMGESEEEFSIPSNWEIRNFGSITREAHTGLERSKAEQSPDRKYVYLKMNNMTNDGRCDLSSVVRVDASKEEVADYALSPGDFLFNTRNSVELVGKTCVFQGAESEPVLLNNNILKVCFIDGCDSRFINLWFCCPAGRIGLSRLKSSTTNVAAIYQGKLNTFLIPLPPLAEQRRIVAKVDELMAVLDALEATLTTARATAESLLTATVAKLHAA